MSGEAEKRVRDLHAQEGHFLPDVVGRILTCAEDGAEWPCDTIRALDEAKVDVVVEHALVEQLRAHLSAMVVLINGAIIYGNDICNDPDCEDCAPAHEALHAAEVAAELGAAKAVGQ